MKKIVITILSLVIVILSASNSFAQTTLLSNNGNSSRGVLKDVKRSLNGTEEEISIYVSSYSSYNVFRLANPQRIVVDISGVEASGKQQLINVNSKLIKSIRHAQFDEGIARVVLDVNGELQYRIAKKTDLLVLYIYNSNGSSSGKVEDTDKNSTEQSAAKEDKTELSDRSGDRKQRVSVNSNFSIEYSGMGSRDEVAILLDNYKNYNVMRLTGPDRIVIDIPDVKAPGTQQKVSINSALIKAIRYAQFENNTARVVLDVTGQSQYSVNENKGSLILNIENPSSNDLIYHNNGDRVYFTLDGAKLTEGGEDFKKFYTDKYDSTGKKYTITFPSELANLKSKVININDGLLNSVQIINNTGNKTTSIVFNAKGKFIYRVFSRPEVNDTAITILKPASKDEKLVVIDVGHGGREPGAIYGSLYEKDLNLDIAKRLNSLLKKKKINTYMIREDDSYVELYERAFIANDLNASLFLSIHNNAIGDPNYGGTMTLYFPPRSGDSGFNGKTFAQIVQSKLLNRLATKDRKIIERPNLVVLKATKMPSTLAEVAFMTNSGDRSNLQKTSFRQNAAQALCDAIVEALSKVK